MGDLRRALHGRRQARRACGLLLVAAVAAGCGGAGGADRSAAEGAVREYVDALVRGDGEAGCERMTEQVWRAFEVLGRPEGCAAAFAEASEHLGDEQRRLLDEARITIDDVDGDLARGTIAVEGDLSTPVEVWKVDGRWLYATPPRAAGAPPRVPDESRIE